MEVAFQARRRYPASRWSSPIAEAQSNGIEDARFVEFQDGGRKTYLATYTAYSGRAIRSELIETSDFVSFRLTPLRGSAARNKGMALFPRKIGGRYAMIGRQDNENLYLIYSDDLYAFGTAATQFWRAHQFPAPGVRCRSATADRRSDSTRLAPAGPQASAQSANSSIGAVLLDKTDPSKVLARSSEPLVRPEPSEREGYVPNVVYTCGAMRHRDLIILPYAVSDTYSTFASIGIADLIQTLRG